MFLITIITKKNLHNDISIHNGQLLFQKIIKQLSNLEDRVA